MSGGTDRRNFLKLSATLLTAAAAGGCEPDAAVVPEGALDRELLRATGEAALPSELGPEGRERVVAGFEQWLGDFEPVAELSHGYGTSEIRYGMPDPGPRWMAQLAALDLEAQRRHQTRFPELPLDERRKLIRRQITEDGLPETSRADHVSVGLLAYFYQTPEATDLCYQRGIQKLTCRSLHAVTEKPPSLAPETRST